MDPEVHDSIAAAKRLSQSARLRALLVAIWPFVYPVAMAAVGWVVKSIQVDRQFAEVNLQLGDQGKKLDTLLLNQAQDRDTQKRHLLAVGQQAAYATAATITGEAAKLVAQKRSAGKDKSASYRRLVLDEGADPETAFAWLFPDR